MNASNAESSEMFCLECMFKHGRDLEHHAEDAYRITKDPFYDRIIDTMREIRKGIFDRMREKPASCPGCEGVVEPGQNPNPELAELEKACTWRKEEVKPKEYFEPASFRTLCPECPEARCALCPPELACATRIIIGCPLGQWDAEKGLCKVATEAHVIYHGAPKP